MHFSTVLVFIVGVTVVVPVRCALEQEEKDLLLADHIAARENVQPPASNMAAMTWDDDLAAVAQAHADKCGFKHSSSGYGENLYMTWGGSVTNAVKKWESEKAYYTYSSNSCQDGKVCGHYTQVVWATSTKLGCGVASCPNKKWMQLIPLYVVCNYSPPGNWRGKKPYET